VQWERAFLEGQRAQAQLAYWKQRLDALPALEWPHTDAADRPASSHEVALEAGTVQAIAALGRALDVGPPAIFLGALMLLVQRHTGEDGVAVAMPVLGRPEARFDAVIGHFANVVVVRERIAHAASAAELLRALRLTMADAQDHGDYPFAALMKACGAPSSRVQVMYAYQSFAPDLAGAADTLPIRQEGTHDLALEVLPTPGGLRLRFDCREGVFPHGAMERAMRHYIALLAGIARAPHAALASHAWLTPEEAHAIAAWSSGGAAVEAEDIVAAFVRQARASPGAPALVCGEASLTYAELHRASDALAGRLLSSGVARGDLVGACLARGPGIVVALIATWKAGAVYVPLSHEWPAQRLARLAAAAPLARILTDADSRAGVEAADETLAARTIAIEGAAGDAAPEAGVAVAPDDAAYVIYTSGSTGEPKGVVVSRGAISRHARVMRERYGLGADDRVLQLAPATVDTSLEQVLPALLAGAAVAMRPEETWSPAALRERIASLALTVIDVPPAYLHELIADTDARDAWAALASLRLAIVGGEALDARTAALWHASPLRTRRLVNAYGPTEATITCTAFEVSGAMHAEGAVPIGRPLPGVTAHVIDARGAPVPAGVAGELHIGGDRLALGYLGDRALTAEWFRAHDFAHGAVLYRTGDRVRWREDGELVFLGRMDEQVKVRGFRVECGEVEAALRTIGGVRDAAVVLREHGEARVLAAYVVLDAPAADAAASLRAALARTLPVPMVPSSILVLPSLPRTAAGKIDRQALRTRAIEARTPMASTVPRTPDEARVAEAWREVLGLDAVGVDDDFFAAGGDSLAAIRLAARLARAFGQDLSVAAIVDNPDIARQARLLASPGAAASPLVCLRSEGRRAPWFCVHGASGHALAYRELARRLDADRPVYAFEAPQPARHPGSVQGLAALYVAALRRVQPHGPYWLGGWSMGGVVAYEMARQLEEAGESIGALLLIDSFTPEAVRRVESAGAAPAYERTPVFEANAAAMEAYTPSGGGSLALFVAEGSRSLAQGGLAGGWHGLARVERVVEVPGDHEGMLRAPHVDTLAARLAEALA
jgi:amino acid adenylation domain-containing protein